MDERGPLPLSITTMGPEELEQQDRHEEYPSQNTDQLVGLILAISSSVFIGASFIIKKRGLRMAGSTGLRAGMGGFSYLREPTWWAGLLSMIVGEAANFTAYAFAPAILVTPLGALSIIISAILAHMMLNERLNMFGMLGCVLCITGSFTIVMHAPPERAIHSVLEVWQLALQPAFLFYAFFATSFIVFLIWHVAPSHGTSNIFVYIGICSLAGSLSVMSCKALGIAIKLTFQGDNQLKFIETYFCLAVVVCCVLTQMNYLNKALDLFNTAIVSPVYYVMFTTLTILASVILFKDIQSSIQIATEVCGFLTIVAGTFLLHTTKDLELTVTDLGKLTLTARSSGGVPGNPSIGGAAGGIMLGTLSGKDREARERLIDRDGSAYHSVAIEEDAGSGAAATSSKGGSGNVGQGSASRGGTYGGFNNWPK